MEFFQNLYPQDKTKTLIKALKVLQENLGDFQDLEVQISHLEGFGEQMVKEGKTQPRTLMAMGILIADMADRQHQAREEFAARFTSFTSPENRSLFKELFATTS